MSQTWALGLGLRPPPQGREGCLAGNLAKPDTFCISLPYVFPNIASDETSVLVLWGNLYCFSSSPTKSFTFQRYWFDERVSNPTVQTTQIPELAPTASTQDLGQYTALGPQGLAGVFWMSSNFSICLALYFGFLILNLCRFLLLSLYFNSIF